MRTAEQAAAADVAAPKILRAALLDAARVGQREADDACGVNCIWDQN